MEQRESRFEPDFSITIVLVKLFVLAAQTEIPRKESPLEIGDCCKQT